MKLLPNIGYCCNAILNCFTYVQGFVNLNTKYSNRVLLISLSHATIFGVLPSQI